MWLVAPALFSDITARTTRALVWTIHNLVAITIAHTAPAGGTPHHPGPRALCPSKCRPPKRSLAHTDLAQLTPRAHKTESTHSRSLTFRRQGGGPTRPKTNRLPHRHLTSESAPPSDDTEPTPLERGVALAQLVRDTERTQSIHKTRTPTRPNGNSPSSARARTRSDPPASHPAPPLPPHPLISRGRLL